MQENCERREMAYEEQGEELRQKIKEVGKLVKCFIDISKNTTPSLYANFDNNHSEMIANAILAYRHLEDAVMRIGKAMQAYQGGTSILDKMTAEERKKISSR